MAMISKVSLSFPPEKMDGKQRDASIFSSLNGGEEIFVGILGIKKDDGEIGVFGAEKYFNGRMDDEPSIPISMTVRKLQFGKIAKKLALESMEKPKIHPGTPSVRSEWSLNSQIVMLQSIEKSPTKSKKNWGKSFLSWGKCTCCDISSVDLMEESMGMRKEGTEEG